MTNTRYAIYVERIVVCARMYFETYADQCELCSMYCQIYEYFKLKLYDNITQSNLKNVYLKLFYIWNYVYICTFHFAYGNKYYLFEKKLKNVVNRYHTNLISYGLFK